jgi:hypothetical protein
MDIALIFELSNSTPEAYNSVVAQLQPAGYSAAWNNGTINVIYYLPKGMLWKRNATLQQGVVDINTAISAANLANPGLGIELVKCITLSAFPYDGLSKTIHQQT